MTTDVHLGFAVGTGEPVAVPIQHLAVTGQTQLSGKTTTLEALVARSGWRAIAFITKRHEATFDRAHVVTPYFRERADWQFVSAVLEATMRERMRFERSWIMRASKGAKTLADVQHNVRRAMLKATGLSADVYMVLDHYLDIVIPQIDQLTYASTLTLLPGLNVMDLSAYTTELQALVIRSVIEWVYEHGHDVLVIIPEAWEFIPQNRGSPVLLACEQLIRKGAAGHNFVWLDSQDIAGVNKNVLRSVGVWILGVQREANEVKRALAHIPGRKPKVDDVMQLERGQFFACFARTVVKVYVQPAWMDTPSAIDIAMGRARIKERAPPTRATWPIKPAEEDAVDQKEATALRVENESLKARVLELEREIKEMRRTRLPSVVQGGYTAPEGGEKPPAPSTGSGVRPSATINGVDLDALYEAIKLKALNDPRDAEVLAILRRVPEIEMRIERVKVEIDSKSVKGRIVKLLAEGFYDEGATNSSTRGALKRTGPDANNANIANILADLQKDGFLTLEGSGAYRAVPGMKVNIIEA
jgi:hypothetical protein